MKNICIDNYVYYLIITIDKIDKMDINVIDNENVQPTLRRSLGGCKQVPGGGIFEGYVNGLAGKYTTASERCIYYFDSNIKIENLENWAKYITQILEGIYEINIIEVGVINKYGLKRLSKWKTHHLDKIISETSNDNYMKDAYIIIQNYLNNAFDNYAKILDDS